MEMEEERGMLAVPWGLSGIICVLWEGKCTATQGILHPTDASPPSSSNHMSLAELQSCWFGNWQVSLFVGHSPGSVKIRIAYKLISVLKEK